MLKSIRQKRIEDDNNKEWAQIRYAIIADRDRVLPNFDNTHYWHDPNESSTWTTNGIRGVALPDPYYNGYKVGDDYTVPIDDLLGYISTSQILKDKFMGALIAAGVGGYITGGTAGAIGITQYINQKLIQTWGVDSEQLWHQLFEGIKLKDGEMYYDALDKLKIAIGAEIGLGPAIFDAIIFPALFSAASAMFVVGSLVAGIDYAKIYKAWNSFEQDSINAQHKVDTEVDDDGNPLWRGYKLVYNIHFGDYTRSQSSLMKLYKRHQLKRGRYTSSAYSKQTRIIEEFSYTKSITYIPA